MSIWRSKMTGKELAFPGLSAVTTAYLNVQVDPDAGDDVVPPSLFDVHAHTHTHCCNLKVSIISGEFKQFLVPPGKIEERKEVFTGQNYEVIVPLADMWCLISNLKFVDGVSYDTLSMCGLDSPPKGYIAARQPAKKKRRFFSDFGSAVEYCAEDDQQVCVWYEYVAGKFSGGAPARLAAYIAKVDAASKKAESPRKRGKVSKP